MGYTDTRETKKGFLDQIMIFMALHDEGVLSCWQEDNNILIAYKGEVLGNLGLNVRPKLKHELELRWVTICVS